MSNFTFNGMGTSLVFGASASSQGLRVDFNKNLKECYKYLEEVQFTNKDFRKFFKSIMLDNRGNNPENKQTFIYLDPPYIGTGDNYSHSFTEQDSKDLFDELEKTGCKFAMSEFDHPFILEQAKQRGLNIITIGERQNLKNRRTEILITNYKNRQPELF